MPGKSKGYKNDRFFSIAYVAACLVFKSPIMRIAASSTICLLFTCICVSAQQKEILLWPQGAPGSEGKAGNERVRVVQEDQVISNIHRPSITPYIPASQKATGA